MTADAATQAGQILGSSLTPEEQGMLSRVLFPDNDTKDVALLGKLRELRPLPVKVAQKIKALLAPSVTDLQADQEATEKDATHESKAEEIILRSLERTATVLAEYYGWEDVKAALSGDGLSLTDLQALAVVQVQVNGSNDFLLASLRTVVKWMQITEKLMIRFQNMLTGPPS
jgi:hypothetical protein